MLKSVGTQSRKQITSLLLLSVLSLLTACASGTTKTDLFLIDEEDITAVRAKCTGDFVPATKGTIEGLWDNKRLILRQSRDCSEAANTLAGKAENRNKALKE